LKRYLKIANVLNSAICVTFEVRNRQYRGEVVELTDREHVMFKVSNVDDELSRVSINHDSTTYLRVMMARGDFGVYQTRLIKKNIPFLQLEFPEEDCRLLEKEYSRQPLDMKTPITVLSRKEGVINGVGTIRNISECGVYLNTGLKLVVEDRIGFYLGFHDSGDKSPLELTGEVKRTIPLPRDGEGSYGIRFKGINIRTLRKVQAFIK